MRVIEKAVEWITAIANNPSNGYDQANRWGPDYDCSSLVISAYKQAGVKLACTYTGNMRSDMLSNGFKIVTDNTLAAGDVLLNEANHTAMYIGNGLIVQASSNENGKVVGGKTGDQTGGEINIRGYYNFPWDCVLRYQETDGGTGADTMPSIYIVKPGDNLTSIAAKAGVSVASLVAINGITDPNRIYPNQVIHFKMEEVDEMEDPADDDNLDAERIYTVVSGDNLSEIALKELGKASRWQEIYEMNNLSSTIIKIGDKLKLPRK